MKTLYTFGHLCAYGTFFVDAKAQLVCYVHEEAMDYQDWTTFDFIPKFFGGEIVELNIKEPQDWLDHDTPEKYLAAIRPKVKAAIKQHQFKRKGK